MRDSESGSKRHPLQNLRPVAKAADRKPSTLPLPGQEANYTSARRKEIDM